MKQMLFVLLVTGPGQLFDLLHSVRGRWQFPSPVLSRFGKNERAEELCQPREKIYRRRNRGYPLAMAPWRIEGLERRIRP